MRRCFLTILLILIPAFASAATVENQYLLVDVDDETGRIFLSSVEGDLNVQGDEKLYLLFYDRPPSSYTVIYVNDDAMIFGSTRGHFQKRPMAIGKSISAIWENNIVRVTLDVEFIQRIDTEREDGALITYRVKNLTDIPQDIGIRILFDTYFGEKRKYHFSIPGTGPVEFELELEREELPSLWVSTDTENPTHCLRGVIQGDVVTSPDKIIFANYKSLRENLFLYRVRGRNSFDNLPYSRDDSAVALFYEPVELGPGETRNFSTILGLCGDGEYGIKEEIVKDDAITESEEYVPKKPVEAESPSEPLEEIDLELIQEELEKIKTIRGSLSEINILIEKINQFLESEDRKIGNEELIQLQSTLSELEDKLESGE